jgi:GT2 family glycosyltransferase
MKILTIVVTYNAAEWLDKCFGSLINSTLPIDILAVDNNSTDNTVQLIKQNYPQVKIYEANENLGFGKANNIGMRLAIKEKTDYVLLLNQDAWVEKNTIKHLVSSALINHEFGIVVPLQLNGSGKLLDEQFQTYTINPSRNLITDLILNKPKKGYYEVPFANAACWLMPLSTVEKIGGFDPLYPHYREDDDYINRLKINGLKVVLNLNAVCFHDREERKPITDLDKMANYAYVGYLLNLKKIETPVYSKSYYLKQLFLNRLLQFTGSNVFHYKANCIGLIKIIKNYDEIINHRIDEMNTSYLYLD